MKQDDGAAEREAPSVVLLKTKSTPSDAYEDYFWSCKDIKYEPLFIPVLQHTFEQQSLDWLKSIIEGGALLEPDGQGARGEQRIRFGGIIFTSQRAVDAFAKVVHTIEVSHRDRLFPPSLPLYVVGPATAKAVRAVALKCPVLGEETGNGDVLADYILDRYQTHSGKASSLSAPRRPLLFLVGEQRRDIIPKKLQSETLPASKQITVVERPVYGTTERAGFSDDFEQYLQHQNASNRVIWIVIFSPTGCEAMLRTLGWLNEDGQYDAEAAATKRGRIHVATIGPTTRDFLTRRFSFEPEVCAETPTPEAVGGGIARYMDSIK